MRLTERDDQGNWCLKGLLWKCLYSGETITTTVYERVYGALCKLKDYEDTGLSPEEVEQLKDFERSQVGKMLKKLNEEERKHRWIPVEERLPENGGPYIATLDGEIWGEEQHFVGLAEFENGKWLDDEEDYRCILAWMPLPEPYRPSDERPKDSQGV